jgi:hypothetical protein
MTGSGCAAPFLVDEKEGREALAWPGVVFHKQLHYQQAGIKPNYASGL